MARDRYPRSLAIAQPLPRPIFLLRSAAGVTMVMRAPTKRFLLVASWFWKSFQTSARTDQRHIGLPVRAVKREQALTP